MFFQHIVELMSIFDSLRLLEALKGRSDTQHECGRQEHPFSHPNHCQHHHSQGRICRCMMILVAPLPCYIHGGLLHCNHRRRRHVGDDGCNREAIRDEIKIHEINCDAVSDAGSVFVRCLTVISRF